MDNQGIMLVVNLVLNFALVFECVVNKMKKSKCCAAEVEFKDDVGRLEDSTAKDE